MQHLTMGGHGSFSTQALSPYLRARQLIKSSYTLWDYF